MNFVFRRIFQSLIDKDYKLQEYLVLYLKRVNWELMMIRGFACARQVLLVKINSGIKDGLLMCLAALEHYSSNNRKGG